MSIIAADTIKSRVAGAAVTTTNGLNVGGACTATSFVGDGSNITALSGTNIASGTVAAARVATLNQNTSGTAAGLTGTPNITVGNISAAGGDATVRNITGVAATFTGVLTYEDVTNVDSVGIVTARGGIKVGPLTGVGVTIGIDNAGDAIFAGIVTAGTCFKAGSVSGGAFGPGVGVTITGDGNAVFAGIVTATTLKYGSTSVETAIDAKASTGKAIAMAMVFGF